MEFIPSLPRTQAKVRLYNENGSIELKKYISRDW
jgi:hypothetical protein